MDLKITIPLWLFILLSAVATIVIIKQFLFPGIRWFFRKKINRAIHELNLRLNIQIRPFQLTKRQVLLDRLIHDTQVLEFVQKQAAEDEVPREVLIEKVQRYAREIVPSFNAYIYYRVGYWLSKKLAKLLYRVKVKAEGQKHLQDVSKDATIIFVMNHRSNMDYILVSFLVAEKMTLSYAVGEWARVWPLQGLIKSMGAFFVRRNSRNPLYRKVLERYIFMATNEGVCQAVFPEGGLTKDGLIRPPKLGFLDYMLRNYNAKEDREIIFIPVGINYDRVLEDRTLLLNRSGDHRYSTWHAIKTIGQFLIQNMKLVYKHQWKSFGYASVNFSNPISCKDYCENQQVNFSKLTGQNRFEAVDKLANYLMTEIEHAIPVTPSALIACVLLSDSDTWKNKKQITTQIDRLIESITAKGGALVFQYTTRAINIDAALNMLVLRHLVEIEDNQYRVCSEGKDLLVYYANSIARWNQ